MTERSPIKLTRREFLQKASGAIAALLSYLFLGKPRPVRANQVHKEKLDPPVIKAVEVFKSIKDVLDTEEKLGIIKSLVAYSEGSILIGAEGAENNDPSLPIIATIVEEGEEKYLEVIEREKNQTIIRINLKAFGLENVSIDSVKPRPTGENLLITYHRDGITEYHKYGLKESKSIRLKDGEKKSFLFTAGDRVCFGDKTGSYAVVESIRNNELNTYIEMTTGDQASAGSGGINVNLSQVAAKDKNDHLNTLTYRLAIAKSMDQARNYYYCTNGSSFGYYDDNGWPCIAIDASHNLMYSNGREEISDVVIFTRRQKVGDGKPTKNPAYEGEEEDDFTINVITHLNPPKDTLPKETDTTRLIGQLDNGQSLIAFGSKTNEKIGNQYSLNTLAIAKILDQGEMDIVYVGIEPKTTDTFNPGQAVLKSDGLYWHQYSDTQAEEKQEDELIFTRAQLNQAAALSAGQRYILEEGEWRQNYLESDKSKQQLPYYQPNIQEAMEA